MWKCNSCGASNPDESDVCAGCGAQKPQEAATQGAQKSNGMKLLVAVLALVCVALIGVIVYLSGRNKQAATENAAPINTTVTESTDAVETTAEPIAQAEATAEPSAQAEATAEPTAEPSAEPVIIQTLDRETLFATHSPDEVIATVGGKDLTWQEYFYFLSNEVYKVENYIATMAMYGGSITWSDPWGDSENPDETFADYVPSSTEDYVRLMAAIIELAEENDAGLTDEDLSAVADTMAQTFTTAIGENPTDEQIDSYLKDRYMTRAIMERLVSMEYLYNNTYRALYGENAEKVSEEDALKYMFESGYMSANHILFMTIDPATGEALSEEAVAEKLEKAQAIADELRAIEDKDELLARFAALKDELDEDSGKTAYPNGYTFTPGVMVGEFEDATKALGEYEVSEPVQSSYGYHVILRLPLDADAQLMGANGGAATARGLFATKDFSEKLHDRMDNLSIDYVEGFEKPDLLAYLTETDIG